MLSMGGMLSVEENRWELWNAHQIKQTIQIIVFVWNFFRDVIISYVNPWPILGFLLLNYRNYEITKKEECKV